MVKKILLIFSLIISLFLFENDAFSCTVTPSFTYTVTHTCGLPNIVKALNTSSGNYRRNARYWWKVNNVTIDSTIGLDSVILLLKKTGSNSIKLFVRDSLGCIDSSSASSITVSSNAKRIEDQINGNLINPVWINCIQYISDPDTFRISVSASDTLKKLKIFWGDGTMDTSGTDLPPNTKKKHLYTSLGFFTYKVVTTNGSCIDTVYGSVYNQRQPTAGIVGPPSGGNRGCVPFRLRIVNNSYNISNLTDFKIHWGEGDSTTLPYTSADDTIYHTYRTGVCGASIKLTASNVCGSSIATWNPIDVSDKDRARWQVTNTCDPTRDLVFQNLSTDKYCLLPDIKEYFWDFGDGTTVGWINSRADQSHRYAREGDYVVTLIVKNGCGNDTFRDVVPVYFYPRPGFILNTNRGCAPVSINVTDTSKGRGITRLWTIVNGSNTYTFTDSILNYTFNNPGVFTVRLTVTNRCSTVSLTRTIVVNGRPTSAIGTINNGCVPHTTSFTNNSTSYFNNPTYEWDFGDNTTSTLRNPASKTYSTPGNYTVRLVVKDSCGTDTFRRNFTVYNLPIANLTGDTVGCTFDSLAFNNTSTNSNQFLWDFGDNSTQTTYSTGVNKHSYSITGNLTTRMIAISPAGCRDTAYHNLRIKPGAKALFDLNQNYGCNPIKFSFTNNTIFGKDYRWYANGRLISNSASLNDTTITTDSTVVRLKLIATSASSCQGDSIEKVFFTSKNPESIIVNKDSGCGILKVNFNNNSKFSVKSYWDLGNGSYSNSKNPSTDYISAKKQDSVYQVKLVSENWAGCKDSTTTQIKVFPGPTSNFSMDNTAGCGPLNVNFTNLSLTNNNDNFNTLSFKWHFNNGNTSTLANPSSLFYPSNYKDSFYKIGLKVTTQNGCTDSINRTLQVYPIPEVKFKPDVNSGCQLLKVNFTNLSSPKDTGSIQIMSFKWDGNNGITASSMSFSNTFKASKYRDTTYQVQLVGVSEHGCSDTVKVPITVHPDPLAQFTLNRLNGCTPLNISTNNNSQSFDNGPLTHVWKFGNSYQSYTENDSTIYINNSNLNVSYTVWYEATSQYGCKDTATQQITVYPKPVSNFNVSTTKACAPLWLNVTDNSINPSLYYWGVEKVNYQNGNTNTILLPGINLFDTTYVIAHSVTSTYGCLSDTIYKQVTVLGRPIAEFEFGKDSTCSRETANILNLSLGGFRYNWDFGDNTSSTSVNPKKRYTSVITNGKDTSFNITLRISSSTGCNDTVSKKIYLVTKPTELLTLDKTIGCTDLEVNMSHNSKRFKTVSWDFGDNTGQAYTDTVNHIYVNPSNVAFLEKIVLLRKRFNCLDTSVSYVTVYPMPVAELRAQRNDPCDDGLYQFINRSKNSSSVEWTFDDNSFYTVASFVKVLPSSKEKDTFYHVQMVVKNNYQCADTATQIIKVKPKQVIKFNKKPLESCEKGVVEFRNESTNSVRFFWNFGDGGLSNEINPNYVYNKFGLYKIMLYGYDKDGCVDSSDGSDLFRVIERPKANFNYAPNQPKLPNAVVKFDNLTTIQSVNLNTLRYEWDFGDGSPISNQFSFFDHTYTKAGTVEVKLTAYNQQCSDVVTKTIYIEDPKPIVKFIADVYEGCAPLKVKFTNQTSNAHTFQWIFNDGSPDEFVENPEHVFEFPGRWDVTLRATGTGGTSSFTQQYMITVHPKPHADFISSRQYLNLPNAIFRLQNLSYGSIKHDWYLYDSLGNNINRSVLRDPTFQIGQKGTYGVKLIATSDRGCTDTLFKPEYLNVLQPGNVFAPSGFSPNKNGVNDEFYPTLMNVKPNNYVFRVYNRWGEKLFETTKLYDGWDGTFKEENCQQDVYIWTVNGEYENNDLFHFRGTITLLR